MCLAKWYQVTLHLHNGQTHSCHHPKTHKINLDELADNPSALHNTSQKKSARKSMVKGIRPEECQYCWNIEDTGGISDRITKSNDSYCRPYLEDVIASDRETLWTQNVNPSYVEVSFDYTCNLKCSYCYPHISSSWHQEIKQLGGYPTISARNDLIFFEDKMPLLNREKNPYVDAFWKWWPDLKDDLDTLRITGGEPLLSKDWWRLLDQIVDNPVPELNLGVNTNLSQDHDVITKLIDKINRIEKNVKSFTIFHSLDTGIPDQAEYIRHGLDFDLYKRNLERLLTEIKWPITFSTMCTVSNLSTIGLDTLFDYKLSLKSEYSNIHDVEIDTPYLRNPKFMEIRLGKEISEPYLKNLRSKFQTNETIPGKNVLTLDRIISFASSDLEHVQEKMLMKDFYNFFSEHDRRRNTNFCKTFPQYEEFFSKCKEIS